MLIDIWKPLVIVAQFLNMSLNTIVFIDLFLTMRNPFYPRKKRNPLYKIFAMFIMVLVATIIVYGRITRGKSTLNLYDNLN